MRLFLGFSSVVVLGFAACGGAIVSSAGTAGGGGSVGHGGGGGSVSPGDAGDAGGDDGSDASDASDGGSVFTTTCEDLTDCCAPYLAACADAGGVYEYCNSSECTPGPGGPCLPAAMPAQGEFACSAIACDVGEVCVYERPSTDGCSSHRCMAPPSACASPATCACLQANAAAWLGSGDPPSSPLSCSVDAAGNPSVSYLGE